MKKETLKTIIQSIGVLLLLFGLGGLGGAIDNGTNFVIPAIAFLFGFALIKFCEEEQDEEIDNNNC